ncbi:unnamed protein product [Miscanthus lutarioriparius]|uniref:Uncharacterized protein n=1 Tax=Miscanthus lutarioriparius TaxID=422564 RepID=A0A811P0S1_9POAL|nr:unnamed protein product [Miscanthus lutarioriparius]
MVRDEPLDFENEDDPLLPTARPAKRSKVIGLDDLLLDYLQSSKKDKLKVKAAKSKRGPKGGYDSGEEDDKSTQQEIAVCKIFEEVQQKGKVMDARDDVPPWGQQIFGCQKPPSNLSNVGVENCQLLQSFSAIEGLGFDLEMHQGEGFLEGMLLDGWLLNLVRICGFVEDSIASWTLTNLLHSSNEKLQVSAANFWDGILSLDEAGKPLVNLGYLPSYSVLKRAMLSYGYLFDTPGTKASASGSTAAGGSDDGLPHNIIAWLGVVSACCKIRVTVDLNCLRIVDCITGMNKRSKFLRSQVALQLLKISFGLKVANVEKMLKLVTSINVKEKECDFFRLYVYLVLMDNLLFSSDAFREKTAIVDAWRNYLRNCSTQIGCTD